MSNNIKYFYIRERQPHQYRFQHPFDLNDPRHPYYHRGAPIACVAYKRQKDEDLPGYDFVQYAVSAVNGKVDEFDKNEARSIASFRLTNPESDKTGKEIDRGYCFNIPFETTSTELIGDILQEVADHSFYPSRVRRAAQKWLDGE